MNLQGVTSADGLKAVMGFPCEPVLVFVIDIKPLFLNGLSAKNIPAYASIAEYKIKFKAGGHCDVRQSPKFYRNMVRKAKHFKSVIQYAKAVLPDCGTSSGLQI